MNEERKSPFWPWVVAMLIAVLVAYPLSYGPAWRLRSEGMLPEWLEDCYLPVNIAWQNSPPPVWLGVYWYLNLWMPPSDSVTVPCEIAPPAPADSNGMSDDRSDAAEI
jgi:hypothetical protein